MPVDFHMRKLPKVSVCIPCYNAKKFIAETVKSILGQSYKDFIIHLVDNHSTDRTVKLIEKFHDKRIRIHQNRRNIGMFQNMNRCLELAQSPYIKIVCADDLLEENALSEQVRILDKYSDVVLVYNASRVIDETGKVIVNRKFMRRDRKINGGVLINKILKTGRNPVGEPTGIMIRGKVVKENHLQFSDFFQYISDLEMWIQILKHGNGYYINKILSAFRFHRSSGTASVFKKAVQEHLKLVSVYSEEFNLSLFDHLVIYLKLIYYLTVKRLLLKFL